MACFYRLAFSMKPGFTTRRIVNGVSPQFFTQAKHGKIVSLDLDELDLWKKRSPYTVFCGEREAKNGVHTPFHGKKKTVCGHCFFLKRCTRGKFYGKKRCVTAQLLLQPHLPPKKYSHRFMDLISPYCYISTHHPSP